MFGRSTHQLDPKGRVFVPKRLQDKLPVDANGTRSGMLIRGLDDSLALMSQEGFDAEVARLDTSVFTGEEGLLFQRLFFAYAFPVSLDRNGRLQIPKELREVAGLEAQTEVDLIGLRDRIEIWASVRWTGEIDSRKGDYDQLARKAMAAAAASRVSAASAGGPAANGGGTAAGSAAEVGE